ncbi:unnamed protein product [Adineta ricciae]|uniref:Transposase IS30-like HTH domain-containing protein n=1 Tax=Adineta ricciae TaxID=249248 RepID=A0A816BRG5_ADIRI|nr:unnamed protein product [Adineta ricciae]
MPKAIQLTEDEKRRILDLHKQNYSHREIAKKINRSKTVVINFSKDPLKYGSRKRTGRRRKVDEHTKRHILRAASKKSISCTDIIHDLNSKLSRSADGFKGVSRGAKESSSRHWCQIDLTQGIWHGHASKTSAEKYSICNIYGRSKSVIEERIRVIEKHLQQAQDAITQFEQNHDCLSVLKELNTSIYQLVQEKQQVVKDKFEYQRKMLLLDATDYQLLQNFIDIEPNRRHITWTRHIWKATKDQLIIEEDIALLQNRLLSTTLIPTSDLLHKIINNINTNIQKLNNPSPDSTTTYTSSNSIKTLITLKKDIIQEAIFIHQKEHEQIQTIIQKEQNKFFVQNRYMETTSEYQKRVNAAIENGRQHMIEYANYIQQFRLSTSFNPTDHQP